MLTFTEAQILAWVTPILWAFLRVLALFGTLPVIEQAACCGGAEAAEPVVEEASCCGGAEAAAPVVEQTGCCGGAKASAR